MVILTQCYTVPVYIFLLSVSKNTFVLNTVEFYKLLVTLMVTDLQWFIVFCFHFLSQEPAISVGMFRLWISFFKPHLCCVFTLLHVTSPRPLNNTPWHNSLRVDRQEFLYCAFISALPCFLIFHLVAVITEPVLVSDQALWLLQIIISTTVCYHVPG